MRELMARVASAELGRDRGLATRCHVPFSPATELNIVFELDAIGRFERKEVLCELRLYSSEGTHIAADGNWPVSEKLGSSYQYLPTLDGPAQVKLEAFRNATPFAAACIHLRLWNSKENGRSIALRRCFVVERLAVGPAAFIRYQEMALLEKEK